jgi:hypothetical protein
MFDSLEVISDKRQKNQLVLAFTEPSIPELPAHFSSSRQRIRATLNRRECLAVPHPKKRQNLGNRLFAKPAQHHALTPRNPP